MYPWATLQDVCSYTLSTAPKEQENSDGLVYSQFYQNIKTVFEASKVFVFENTAIEHLAHNTSFAASQERAAKAKSTAYTACKNSYLHSKGRANSNLEDNQRRSYSVREEHRISLTFADKVCQLWEQWDEAGKEAVKKGSKRQLLPLPYYIVFTSYLFGFLQA